MCVCVCVCVLGLINVDGRAEVCVQDVFGFVDQLVGSRVECFLSGEVLRALFSFVAPDAKKCSCFTG